MADGKKSPKRPCPQRLAKRGGRVTAFFIQLGKIIIYLLI